VVLKAGTIFIEVSYIGQNMAYVEVCTTKQPRPTTVNPARKD